MPILYFRDFILGEHIDDEIVYHMSESRMHIVVLSKNSVKKFWPNFELQRACMDKWSENKKVIMLKLGKISTDEISGLAKQILAAEVCLEWHNPEEDMPIEDNAKQQLFWAKLLAKLYGTEYPCYLKNFPCCCKSQIDANNLDQVWDDSMQLLQA